MPKEEKNPTPLLTIEMLRALSDQEIVDEFNKLSDQVFKVINLARKLEKLAGSPEEIKLLHGAVEEYLKIKKYIGLPEHAEFKDCLQVINQMLEDQRAINIYRTSAYFWNPNEKLDLESLDNSMAVVINVNDFKNLISPNSKVPPGVH